MGDHLVAMLAICTRAEDMMIKMPVNQKCAVWMVLLVACRFHCNACGNGERTHLKTGH
jgi:hypothetical protein